MVSLTKTGLLILAFFFLTTACSTVSKKQTLYQQLGGQLAINSIVDNLIQEIGQDNQIFHYFADTKISRFRTQLQQHLCYLSDGPCMDNEDSMEVVHTGMAITEKDFNHLVDLLIKAMEQAGIPHRIQNQLLARLAPLRKEVISL